MPEASIRTTSPTLDEPSISPWPDVAVLDHVVLAQSPSQRALAGSQGIRLMQDFAARADYCARVLLMQADAIVQAGFNAFVHSSQLVASSPLRDALAACALHTARSPNNTAMVTAEISRRSCELIETVSSARRSSAGAAVDLLSSAQALLIYQCIRLFFPDRTQQSQAERDSTMLQDWTRDLSLDLCSLDDAALCDVRWETWVRTESIRRTLVCMELVNGTYIYLQGRWPPGMQCHHDLDFTAQKCLWQASTASAWRAARLDPRCSPMRVNMLRFDLYLKYTPLEQLDDVGIMLHVAAEGFKHVDATRSVSAA